jgi:hypothetical protein
VAHGSLSQAFIPPSAVRSSAGSSDPIALDKTNQLLGHVTTTDQGALWQELMGHPKKINYSPKYDFTLSAGIKGEAIWFDLDSA